MTFWAHSYSIHAVIHTCCLATSTKRPRRRLAPRLLEQKRWVYRGRSTNNTLPPPTLSRHCFPSSTADGGLLYEYTVTRLAQPPRRAGLQRVCYERRRFLQDPLPLSTAFIFLLFLLLLLMLLLRLYALKKTMPRNAIHPIQRR